MKSRNIIISLLIITFSVQSADVNNPYTDLKSLVNGISQDLSGSIQQAQALVTQAQTNSEQAGSLKKNAAQFEQNARKALHNIQHAFQRLGQDTFSDIKQRMPSLAEKTYEEWLKSQEEKLEKLRTNISGIATRARGFSEPGSSTSPTSTKSAPMPTTRRGPRVPFGQQGAVRMPRTPGAGVSGASTPYGLSESKTVTFGGQGMPKAQK